MSKQEICDTEKKIAAEKATEFITDQMTVGLGTGSTVFFAIKKIGELVKNGLRIKAVSTSDETTSLARSSGIQLISIDEAECIDLTIDGADEVDKNFNGIKGGGGALLYEKIVALSSKKNVWIVDSAKVTDTFGKFPLPVEVVPFGCERVFKMISHMNPVIRKKGDENYLTDSGNYIFDLHLGNISDPAGLQKQLKQITGIIETGLFIDIADIVLVGKGNTVEQLIKSN